MVDMLKQIVERQITFQKILGYIIPDSVFIIESKENIKALTYQILAMFDEISEALHCIPWKPWKKNQKFNGEHFQEELMDIFHFLINCCILTGMTAEGIFNAFIEKNNINIWRQKDGY